MSRPLTTNRRLPRFVEEMLATCPTAGAGVHNWLFRIARVLHPFFPNQAEMAALIEAACAGCGRDVPAAEIASAIANSEACAWQPRERNESHRQPQQPQGNRKPIAQPSRHSWPARNVEQIEAVVAASGVTGLADLWEASPIRIDWEAPMTEWLIDELFPDNPLLCVALDVRKDFGVGNREDWRGELADQQFIVPSPMKSHWGLRKGDGRKSLRTLDNTGPRRYLVIEFDQGAADAHAAVLWHLGRLAPLVMAVHSGNKSLHGWFNCAVADEAKQLRFMRYAVSLGADPATWTRCQFVRMPDGLRRRDGAPSVRQPVYHFNPHNLP